ncbi:hypothetical protein J9B83_15095 [Marinomonas sp. A79]|uniref:Uncharacterized protein n=1 Tax=Marinomonas vulgaris TaxID=2823372 RepID=A0ABS5HEZ6_9GAMM|nr:hypothetical protein [Marinomonas vulgaris]MBR7890233.1 hypothetical protein [Marinomonas vulgaris]
MTAETQEDLGIRSFDVISANNQFAKQYPELVTAFLKVTNDANADYQADPKALQPTIAKASGLSLADSNQILDLFYFPLTAQHVSPYWMGGGVQTFLKEVADFFVEQNQIPTALDDYSHTINATFFSSVN